jgi:hypothetical protein
MESGRIADAVSRQSREIMGTLTLFRISGTFIKSPEAYEHSLFRLADGVAFVFLVSNPCMCYVNITIVLHSSRSASRSCTRSQPSMLRSIP